MAQDAVLIHGPGNACGRVREDHFVNFRQGPLHVVVPIFQGVENRGHPQEYLKRAEPLRRRTAVGFVRPQALLNLIRDKQPSHPSTVDEPSLLQGLDITVVTQKFDKIRLEVLG